MFNKYMIIAALIPCIFLASSPAAEASLTDWEQESTNIQKQRDQIKEQLKEATRKEKVTLTIKDNKLAGYQNAYDTAIEYVQLENEIESTETAATFNFMAAKLLPGEVVPTEYIPYYKAAGEKYGVDWTVLAAIHDIETDYSKIKVMVSSVGAIGHMQFMPKTFEAYGVDGDGDGRKNAYSLPDSIYSAANYLSKSGYKKDVRKAIWHYNHAEWYINDVLTTASKIRNS